MTFDERDEHFASVGNANKFGVKHIVRRKLPLPFNNCTAAATSTTNTIKFDPLVDSSPPSKVENEVKFDRILIVLIDETQINMG